MNNKKLYMCLVALLLGKDHELIDLPSLPEYCSRESHIFRYLLKAASFFATGNQERGYDSLISAMQVQDSDISMVIKTERFLPSLCNQFSKKKNVPIPIKNAICKLALTTDDNNDCRIIAQCAAALGEVESACHLWEETVANKNGTDDASKETYTNYLCYLAAEAYKKGDYPEAINKLRRAAALGAGGK
jgi:tetratricopeptide (TPR) repeat protein